MRKSMKTILAALALATPLALTSCEGTLDDIFGEWDKPSANTNPAPAVDHSNQYLVYSYSTALDSVWTNIEGATEWNISTGDVAAGTYVVSSDFTCTGALVLKGDVNLIIKDGAKLTVNDGISYDPLATGGALNIYGQGISSSMGQLVVKNNNPTGTTPNTEATAIFTKAIEIHGCLINTQGAGDIGKGLESGTSLKIFNGKVVALATGHGIATAAGDMFIYGGDIDAQSSSATYACAICSNGNLTIDGGIVKAAPASAVATGVYGIGANGVYTITISGGTVNATGSGNTKNGIVAPIIDIKGGTVVATTGNSGNGAIECSSLTISGAETKVTAIAGANSPGIDASTINISGSTIEASNGAGGYPAIIARTSLTIDGSETQVTATGGNDDGTWLACIGIQSPAITIKAGTVTAKGGNGGAASANGSVAVWCTGTLQVDGGTITATGGDGYPANNGNGGFGITATTVITNCIKLTATGGAAGGTGNHGEGFNASKQITIPATLKYSEDGTDKGAGTGAAINPSGAVQLFVVEPNS